MSGPISEITDRNKCTGCRACEQACPFSCIHMKENEEGFLFPHVQNNCCIGCEVCRRHCPANEEMPHRNDTWPQVYAVKIKDKTVLKESTSGGAFSLFADYVLQKGGNVFGCVLNSRLEAVHVSATAKDGINPMRGSKYVQSDTQHTFMETEQCLQKGRWVCYSGTPCQIAGLKSYLGKPYEKLITVDLICHGVPSPRFFKEYLQWLSKKMGREIDTFAFRSKEKSGWGYLEAKIEAKSKTKYLPFALDPYYSSFMAAQNYRESCYSCKYASLDHQGDFTIGDFWGIKKFHQELSPAAYEGISVLLVNNKKAEELLLQLTDLVSLTHSSVENACAENYNLVQPAVRPSDRTDFYKNAYAKGFGAFADSFYHTRAYKTAFLRSLVPAKAKLYLKKLLRKV